MIGEKFVWAGIDTREKELGPELQGYFDGLHESLVNMLVSDAESISEGPQHEIFKGYSVENNGVEILFKEGFTFRLGIEVVAWPGMDTDNVRKPEAS